MRNVTDKRSDAQPRRPLAPTHMRKDRSGGEHKESGDAILTHGLVATDCQGKPQSLRARH
eukprot:7748971-Pyramimonas_sp.AAC.1